MALAGHFFIAGEGAHHMFNCELPLGPQETALETPISSQLLGDVKGFRVRQTLSLIFLIWKVEIILSLPPRIITVRIKHR